MRRTLTLLLITAAAASFAPCQPADEDPPSRVARLNFIQGQVSFRPGSVDEWTAATLNYPLYNGDHLWADRGAQTELHIGSTAIRMGSETALAILALDDRMAQLSLTGGVLNVHLRTLGDGDSFEVDTPNAAVTLLRTGDYRIRVDENSALTEVTVHGGDAEVTGGNRAFAVHPRESARIMGIDDTFSSEIAAAPPSDGFDFWCQERDRREERSASARYVGRETIGYEDLDDNGVWTEVPEYGRVWRPNVIVAGWAPYRFGHWAWVEPWGWTWVDDAPWGFAPFHYGRWTMWGGGWVWVPGALVARPVYAPALVAFVGGSGFSMAVRTGGGPAVAWFPLGPREVYRPAYHVSEVYVRQVNITHVSVTNIGVTNVRYVNQNVAGAVTVVSHETFVGARPVHTAVVAVPPGAMAQAQVVGTAAPVAPERVSVMGRVAPVGRVAAPPPRMAERTVVVRNTPPPPPVSFAARHDVLMQNPGRPLDPAAANTLRRGQHSDGAAGFRSAQPAAAPRPAPMPEILRPERPIAHPQPQEPAPPRQIERQQVQQQPRQVERQPAAPPRQVEAPRGEARQEIRSERKEVKAQHKEQKKEEKKEEKK